MKCFTSIGVALLVVSVLLSAQAPDCSEAQALAAETGFDRLKTWADLHSAFQQFQACDDGGIAEGWDDFVARMLGQSWNKLVELQKLAAADSKFRAFVIRHISNTADGHDLDQTLVNAPDHCPQSAGRLCEHRKGN